MNFEAKYPEPHKFNDKRAHSTDDIIWRGADDDAYQMHTIANITAGPTV